VFPEEPWPRLRDVAGRPGLWLTPHAAGYHVGLARAVREELDATIAAWLGGEDLPAEVG
jgi:phosphoglycerate dehydrogenase-like enzyme